MDRKPKKIIHYTDFKCDLYYFLCCVKVHTIYEKHS